MELRHLRYFMAVADELNFSRAAEKLMIAQPPLSRQIQDLEAELGTKLFIRSPHKLQLTEEGVLFLDYANRVLHLVDKAAEDIRDMKDGLQGVLYLASVEGHGPHMFAEWMSGFQKSYPNVEYNLWDGSTDDVVNRISNGLCELGIITEPYNGEGLEAIHLYAEPWVAMIPADAPLAAQEGDTVTFKELEPFDLIIPSRQSRAAEIRKWFAVSGAIPKIRCRIAHTLSAFELTRQGVGVAIFPASVVESVNSREICVKRLIEPEVQASYMLVWDKKRPLSKVATEFLNYIYEKYDFKQ